MLEITRRSVSDPTVEIPHLSSAAQLVALSGQEAERERVEK